MTQEQEQGHPYSTQGRISASRLELDPRVNPRTGNDNWVRSILGEPDRNGRYAGYNPSLLGQFVLSQRPGADGEEDKYIVLDGANRRRLMQLAGDMDREVSCEIWHGMDLRQEAAHAKGLNDRRGWSPVRKFLADVTAGVPEAVVIRDALESNEWGVGISKGNGILTGVAALKNLIRTAERLSGNEIEKTGVKKGTEQHRAAILNGRQDGVRTLSTSISIVTAAWPKKEPNYTGDVIYGVGLILLRDGSRVDITKMSEQLAKVPGGKLALITTAKALRQVHPSYKIADAVAAGIIERYNMAFSPRNAGRLELTWQAMAV